MTLNIPFDNGLILQSDKHQFIIYDSKIEKNVCFFTKFESVVEWLFSLKIKTSHAKTIHSLNESIKRAENGCQKLIEDYKGWLQDNKLEEIRQ